jgi:hypothetical protein
MTTKRLYKIQTVRFTPARSDGSSGYTFNNAEVAFGKKFKEEKDGKEKISGAVL